MIELDGSTGGGQFLRSALALSAVTGEPFRMESIRGGRPEPGLRAQHLAAVELIASITGADVTEVSVGTDELTFEPGRPEAGTRAVDIGTAGSVTLLFDAVLPLALGIDGGLSVTARGGTDVKWSPPMAHHRRVKLPLLRRSGVYGAVDPVSTGFYPVGGGEATLHLAPSDPEPIDLRDRGERRGAAVYALASTDLEDADVAERGARAAADELHDAGVDAIERTVAYAEAGSPGAAVLVRIVYEGSTVGGDALGERGKPAEAVGREAAEGALSAHGTGAAVDPHVADQLVPFLALGGGRASIPAVTDHVESGLELAEAFGRPVWVERDGGPAVIAGHPPD